MRKSNKISERQLGIKIKEYEKEGLDKKAIAKKIIYDHIANKITLETKQINRIIKMKGE